MDEIAKKTNKAIKWSSITELLARMITPIINMLLARILVPEDFGVLATITMVLSFAEIFVESGFSKFLIQHDFKTTVQERQYMNVAFWSNLIFSIFIWGLIIAFRVSLASWAGNESLGFPLAVSGIAIPLYGIIGIQTCQLKKQLDFKRLFFVRIISAFVPLFVTLPLALSGLEYWSLVIGNTVGLVVQSSLLVIYGRFKPSLYFDWKVLKSMLDVGVWTLFDGCVTWVTAWVDSLLISRFMTDYYLGIYKNSASTINTLFAVITSALTPVLFASLSKLQNNEKEFNTTFMNVQKILTVFLLPLSIGVFIYRDFVTWILFGDRWGEAANIIGVMAITTALRIIFVRIYSEAYRAKGRFRLPLVLQLVDILILVPTCIIAVGYGFWSLVYARALVNLDLIIPELIVSWVVLKINPKNIISNIYPSVIATFLMAIVGCALQLVYSNVAWVIISILICIVVYFFVLFLFKKERKLLLQPLLNKIMRKV